MSEFPFQVKVPVNHVGLTLFSTLIKSACLMFKPYLRLSTRLPRAVTGMGMFLLHHHSCRHAEACRLGVQQGSFQVCFCFYLRRWDANTCVLFHPYKWVMMKNPNSQSEESWLILWLVPPIIQSGAKNSLRGPLVRPRWFLGDEFVWGSHPPTWITWDEEMTLIQSLCIHDITRLYIYDVNVHAISQKDRFFDVKYYSRNGFYLSRNGFHLNLGLLKNDQSRNAYW